MPIVSKTTTFKFHDGTDIEFVPSTSRRGVYEVWVNGVHIEEMEQGARPSEIRAHYYYEVHSRDLGERLEADEPQPQFEAAMH